jgi:hypothetical protein
MGARGLALLGALVAGPACALVAGPALAAAAEPARALAGLVTVAVDVELESSPERVSSRELVERIRARLAQDAPALTLDPGARDRLRLAVAVRPHSASALRGFWLPFSGTYGIGPVSLSLERVVTIAGVPDPVRASVWRAERQALGPWHESSARILELLDANLADFLAAYRAR